MKTAARKLRPSATTTTKRAKKQPAATSDTEDGYGDFVDFTTRAMPNLPLFTTNAEGLFETFLRSLPKSKRQHYTCNACRKFIDTYGGLASIDAAGRAFPALWSLATPIGAPPAVPPFFEPGAMKMRDRVRAAQVTGVFLSPHVTLGTPKTGPWRHLHAHNPKPYPLTHVTTAEQAMAAKLEEHAMLTRALGEWSETVASHAVHVLKSDAMYRSEKCLGVAEWFLALHVSLRKTSAPLRRNLIWRAVATAPPGWAHVRSSMIGTLLEDLAMGLSMDAVARRFREKMDPTKYQRPTAAPSAGNIARAETIVEGLRAKGSLRRRFAGISEVVHVWVPPLHQTKPPKTRGGVFSVLHAPKKSSLIDLPRTTITFEKFRRTVMPGAATIEFLVPFGPASFGAFSTACDPKAPPILQWDFDEMRNPVSHYFYANGSTAARWGLVAMEWAQVTAICLKPSMWGRPMPQHGEGVFFLLEGAQDAGDPGLALFPETLRSELHEVRSTIEAYSRSSKLEPAKGIPAAGIGFSKGQEWTTAEIRVTTFEGHRALYKLDRWD